jgi:two-component system phosphate regulon sensor histidine kinase PhoR
MKTRLFLKIFAAAVFTAILAVAVFTFYTVRAVQGATLAELTRGLERAAELVRAVIDFSGEGAGSVSLSRDITRMARQTGVRLTVIDPRGVVLADSDQDPSQMENHAQRPEVASALGGYTGVAQRFSSTIKRQLVYVAVPIQQGALSGGVVRAAFPGAELSQTERALRNSVLLFAAIVFFVCVGSALLLSRWLLAPLRDLTGVVLRFTAGDFGARLHLKRKDEIRNLADSFNSMAERVQVLFSEVSRRTEELDGVFSSVAQGIVLLDGNGRILRANRGFEEIVGQNSVEGKALWEVVHTLPLMDLVEKVRQTGPQPAEEMVIGDKTVLCSIARVAEGDNLITVLQDTTDVKRLEEVKREFVVNASHELRTPLTAIRGFLELLESEVEGESRRWVEVVRRNTERMTAIVEDLLRLSRLEAKGVELSIESVDISRILSDAVELFSGRADEKGLALRLSVAEGLPPLTADPYLVEQLVVNLVDNALKYTESGGIEISCGLDGRWLRIVVSDTGIGIPEEHLSRIFERFYVVDKSRSRKMGGTGLGLAIVKHIVQLHGGTIAVESTVGTGTRFVVRLPVRK